MWFSIQSLWIEFCLQHPMQRFGYRYASELLKQAFKKGCLNPKQIRSICDFGAGLGGPSLALQTFFSSSIDRLVLLEENALQARFAQKILPAVDVIQGDAFDWLNQTNQRFDLVTAFMLGPDYHDDGLVHDFLTVASQRLTERGFILIASDVATMKTVQAQIKIRCAENECGQSQWILPKKRIFSKRFSFFEKWIKPVIPYTVLFKPYMQLSSLEIYPAIPKPLFQPVGDDVYCLTTPFERDYLKATLKTYQEFNGSGLDRVDLGQLLLRQ